MDNDTCSGCGGPAIHRLTLRAETPHDYPAVEHLTREAFFNVYRPGCVEHYMLHLLRQSPAYLPRLHTLALDGDAIVGSIVLSRSWVAKRESRADVLMLGPLTVRPDWQRKGVGSLLMGYALAQARHLGEAAVLLMGAPGYYGRFGFRPAADFGLTLPDSSAPDVFMALPLYPDALKGVQGAWQIAPAFDEPDPKALADYDARFPYREKLTLPGQLFD